jgi:hypothetical protein
MMQGQPRCWPLFRPTRNAHGQSTTTVPGMRSNKPVSMDIDQLRGWASLMDRAMIVSLVATILAVAALGITTFLSFRYSGAVRAHEQAALGRYKGMESQAARLELDTSAAREQAAALEQEIATTRGRTAILEPGGHYGAGAGGGALAGSSHSARAGLGHREGRP